MPGKTWKCRSCNTYNPKAKAVCGECGDPMRILMGGGSSREDPVHSYEQIPQQGYGDGKGNYGPRGKSYGLGAYYAAKGAKGKGYAHLNEDYLDQAGPYGYAPDGRWSYGYGPLAHFSEDYGYGPMQPRNRAVPGSPPATHGEKGRTRARKARLPRESQAVANRPRAKVAHGFKMDGFMDSCRSRSWKTKPRQLVAPMDPHSSHDPRSRVVVGPIVDFAERKQAGPGQGVWISPQWSYWMQTISWRMPLLPQLPQ